MKQRLRIICFIFWLIYKHEKALIETETVLESTKSRSYARVQTKTNITNRESGQRNKLSKRCGMCARGLNKREKKSANENLAQRQSEETQIKHQGR